MQHQQDFNKSQAVDATPADPPVSKSEKTRAEEAYEILEHECGSLSQLNTITDGVSDFRCLLDCVVEDIDLGDNATAALEALHDHLESRVIDDWVYEANSLLSDLISAIDDDRTAEALKDIKHDLNGALQSLQQE